MVCVSMLFPAALANMALFAHLMKGSLRTTAATVRHFAVRRDCGLACVLMVLKGLGIHATSYELLRQWCDTTRYSRDAVA